MSADGIVALSQSPSTAPDGEAPTADRSGPAIISLLRQAADAARRNEERARQMVARMAQEIEELERRNAALEDQLADYLKYKDRAEAAEQWLLHIHDEVQIKLIDRQAG